MRLLSLNIGIVVLFGACQAPATPNPSPAASVSVAVLTAGVDADDEPLKHDAFAGMDRNGRIPKVELPANVPNPDRWRYLPEGRIKPGSILERFLISTFAVPIFFFESDIGVGAGISLTDIDFRSQRRREFANTNISYTSEGQQSYTMNWRRWLHQRDLPGGGVIQEERSFLRAFAGYTNTLTRRFFGIGPNTLESDESSYSEEMAAAEFGVHSSLPEAGSNWVGRVGLRVEKRNLGEGFVEGLPNTGDVPAFAPLFQDGDGLSSLWVRAGLRYDTRDSQANPYEGWTLGGWVTGLPVISGGDSGLIYGLSSSLIVPLAPLLHGGGDDREEHRPTDVLAFTAEIEDSSGDLPFWVLPTLGGRRRLRGYVANRWTDEAAWFGAAEYRFVTVPRGFTVDDEVRVERLGAALFYEVGAVAGSVSELSSSELLDSYGVSLRINLERAAIFRLDLGFSDEGSNFIATYGLSF